MSLLEICDLHEENPCVVWTVGFAGLFIETCLHESDQPTSNILVQIQLNSS